MGLYERRASLNRGERPACAQCGKPERPWRRMMWYPYDGSSAGAFICSDACWDDFDGRPRTGPPRIAAVHETTLRTLLADAHERGGEQCQLHEAYHYERATQALHYFQSELRRLRDVEARCAADTTAVELRQRIEFVRTMLDRHARFNAGREQPDAQVYDLIGAVRYQLELT